MTDGAALELSEERALSLLVLGSVTGGGRCESLDEAAARGSLLHGGSGRAPLAPRRSGRPGEAVAPLRPASGSLGLGALNALHGLVVETEVVTELVHDRV